MRSDQSVPDGVIFVWPLLRRYCRRECGSPGITAGAHSLVGCDQTRASQMRIGEVAHYFQSCWASLGYRYRYAYSNYYLPAVRCSGAVDCCNVLCSGRPLSRRHGLLMDVSRRRMLPSTNIITQGAHRMNDARGRVCSQGIRSPGIAARRAASGTWQQHMAHPAGLGFMITGCNRSPTFPVLVAVPLSCFCSCFCFCS